MRNECLARAEREAANAAEDIGDPEFVAPAPPARAGEELHPGIKRAWGEAMRFIHVGECTYPSKSSR